MTNLTCASVTEILVVEDDLSLQRAITRALTGAGYAVSAFTDAQSMLQALTARTEPTHRLCVLMDVNLGNFSGLDAQRYVRAFDAHIPVVFMSADENARNVQQAWQGGASGFLFKPFTVQELQDALERALHIGAVATKTAVAAELVDRVARLSTRQRQVFRAVALGHSHQKIAQTLGIAERTVKLHRAAVMQTLGCTHLADLVRIYENCKHLLNKQEVVPERTDISSPEH